MSNTDMAGATLPKWLIQVLYVIGFLVFYTLFVGLLTYVAGQQYLRISGLSETVYQQRVKSESGYMLAAYVPNFLLTMLAIWLYWKFALKNTWSQIGWVDNAALRNIFYGLLVGIIAISLGFAILYFSGHLHILELQWQPKHFINYVLVFLMVAISEEVMTRGLMLHTLMQGMNKYLALLIVSLIFGAMHLLNDNVTWLSFLSISLAGVFLGISYVHNLSLYFPIGLHFAWNFFQGAVYGFEVSGHQVHGLVSHTVSGPEVITGGPFGFEGSIIALPIIILASVAIHFWYKTSEQIQTPEIAQL